MAANHWAIFAALAGVLAVIAGVLRYVDSAPTDEDRQERALRGLAACVFAGLAWTVLLARYA